jgi:hypothetical protein
MIHIHADLTKESFLEHYKQGDWVIVVCSHNYTSWVEEIGGEDMTPQSVWNYIETSYAERECDLDRLMVSTICGENGHVWNAGSTEDALKIAWCTLSYIAQEQGNQVSK